MTSEAAGRRAVLKSFGTLAAAPLVIFAGTEGPKGKKGPLFNSDVTEGRSALSMTSRPANNAALGVPLISYCNGLLGPIAGRAFTNTASRQDLIDSARAIRLVAQHVERSGIDTVTRRLAKQHLGTRPAIDWSNPPGGVEGVEFLKQYQPNVALPDLYPQVPADIDVASAMSALATDGFSGHLHRAVKSIHQSLGFGADNLAGTVASAHATAQFLPATFFKTPAHFSSAVYRPMCGSPRSQNLKKTCDGLTQASIIGAVFFWLFVNVLCAATDLAALGVDPLLVPLITDACEALDTWSLAKGGLKATASAIAIVVNGVCFAVSKIAG